MIRYSNILEQVYPCLLIGPLHSLLTYHIECQPFLQPHPSMKEGSLFVLFCPHEIHRTGMLQIAFLVSLESSGGGGVHLLGFMPVRTCSEEVLEY